MTGAVHLIFEREIAIKGLRSGYQLVPGTESPLGLPVEGFLRLYAVDGSGILKLMRTLFDVLTVVEAVQTEKEAIQLLRLETSPETHFLFPNSHYVDARVSRTLERPGDVSERAATAAGYTGLTCESLIDAFEVSRDLLRWNSVNPPALVRRKEWLSRTAEYRRLSEVTIGNIDPSQILLPEYE